MLTGTPSRASGSATVILPVQHNGGTSLSVSGDPTSQFQVFPSGQNTGALTISSVDVSRAFQIALTLGAPPPNSQALDVWYRPPFDSSATIASGIYDNDAAEADGLSLGRQLAVMPATLTVPAPSQAWHRPILIQPGVPICVRPGILAFAG
jgi:hypothetical protein